MVEPWTPEQAVGGLIPTFTPHKVLVIPRKRWLHSAQNQTLYKTLGLILNCKAEKNNPNSKMLHCVEKKWIFPECLKYSARSKNNVVKSFDIRGDVKRYKVSQTTAGSISAYSTYALIKKI